MKVTKHVCCSTCNKPLKVIVELDGRFYKASVEAHETCATVDVADEAIKSARREELLRWLRYIGL